MEKQVAPKWRFHSHFVAKGYSQAGASHTKRNLKSFKVSSGAPSEDIDANNYTLRQRSRMLYMSSPLATGALKRQRTNIVGSGLWLKSTIDRDVLGMTKEQAEAWQRHVQAEFALWAEKKQTCDFTGMNNFYGLQQLVALAWPMSGDVFALVRRVESTDLAPYALRLHVIEADRVRTPDGSGGSGLLAGQTKGKDPSTGNVIYDGVEVDQNGAVVAYHVANTHPYQLDGTETRFARVEAYGKLTGLPNVLHVMDSERPEQYRGVPYLAQVIEPLLQIRRYTEAEITAAVVQSFFTAFIKTEADPNVMPFNEVGSGIVGAGAEPQGGISSDPNEYEMGPGGVNIMKPGEDVTFASPTHPNTGFDTFVKAMVQQVGAALEMPADLLMMSFNASYSASRGALLEAWKGFKMRREWLADSFCRPVYEIWLTEAVARGRVSAPGFLTDPLIRQAYLGSEWIGPSQGTLNPVQEVNAEILAVENGFTTREAAAVKLSGSEFSRNVDKLATENELLRAASGGTEPAPAAPAEPTDPVDPNDPGGDPNKTKEGNPDG